MVNSLSYHVRLVAGLHLEPTEVFPQVDGVCDACNTALVNLRSSAEGHADSQCHTISAASVPAIENSKSAYFFQ